MKISIILPTYNNEKTIEECLASIFSQNFPEKDFEVLFIDGNSSDKTLKIAKKYPVKIIDNEKRIEEAARILGIKKAKGEILVFIDADNVLDDSNWLEKMFLPFKDKEIAFADTLFYDYRKKDKIKSRYQALIGGDDPLACYLGLYSRWCYFKKNWTDFPYSKEVKQDYWKCSFSDKRLVPAMGSNGFAVRKKIAVKFVKNKFIHSDFVYELVNNNYNCFAKILTGIVHNQPRFFPNKIRRIKRRLNKEVDIKYNYGITGKKMLKTALYSLSVLPVLCDIFIGFVRKPSLAWFFHPIALYGELGIHFYYNFKYKLFGKA